MYKFGDEILVRDNVKDLWKVRMFLAHSGTDPGCVLTAGLIRSHSAYPWLYHKPLVKGSHEEHTRETFPKGVTWVRYRGATLNYLVTAIHAVGIDTSDYSLTYEELLENYEISTDLQETWKVAGVSDG